MPLGFKKIKPVDFEDFTAMPQVTPELRLRVQNLKFATTDQLEQAKDVLSSAFPEDKDRVRKFMEDNYMGAISLQELQAYLIGGEEMLERFRRNFDKVIDKSAEKALGEMSNEING